MKFKLIILISIIINGCTPSPKSDDVEKVPNVKDTVTKSKQLNSVETIQKDYNDIILKQQNASLDSTAFKYSCHGEKGGTVSYFTENGKLCLITHQYNEYDHYSAVDRYFVKDSTLFFINSNSTTWAFESGPEGSTKDNIIEKRVYFVKGQPIKCVEKKFTIRSQAKNNPSTETVPNREVDCLSAENIVKPYQLLIKYRNKPTSGCLD